jgi:NAD(P)H-dependent flavin oxidoreductase YrpB (nitropropane dioxygenase family)
MTLQQLMGIELPVIQAPMAGVQGSALAIAVSNAGGLGSLPCAMLGLDAIRSELAAIHAQSSAPFNVNFFCHVSPSPSVEREAVWRATLSRYYKEFGIDIFTGRPARGIVNRIMRELGPMSSDVPAFPLATSAIAPLRAQAEARGSGDFSPLWSGQNVSGCKEVSAAQLTQELAADL